MPQRTKRGRQTINKHKQGKHDLHKARCLKNKSRRVKRSSHGKFENIETYNAQRLLTIEAKKK